ncbi:NPHP3, partial [Symbiodinium sp. KB8]
KLYAGSQYSEGMLDDLRTFDYPAQDDDGEDEEDDDNGESEDDDNVGSHDDDQGDVQDDEEEEEEDDDVGDEEEEDEENDEIDGLVRVWRHALDLRDAQRGSCQQDLCVLYHYTHELAFRNVANKKQTTAELFASLLDSRAHFGKGVYCTQYEPAVWGSRTRILLNNYSNLSPLRDTTDSESQRVENEWGTGNSGGHRAAFCIPILVSRELAYNIFERQTPDLARKSVRDAETGEERRIRLGEDYKGRPVDRNRDVWVVQVMNGAGEVQHAGAEADGLLRLLRTRLANLREELGDDAEPTLDCMHELGSRLLGRAYYDEAEILYKECLDRRRANLGERHKDTLDSVSDLVLLLEEQGRYEDAELLARKELAQGQYEEAESLLREELEGRTRLGEMHPETLTSMNNLGHSLQALAGALGEPPSERNPTSYFEQQYKSRFMGVG